MHSSVWNTVTILLTYFSCYAIATSTKTQVSGRVVVTSSTDTPLTLLTTGKSGGSTPRPSAGKSIMAQADPYGTGSSKNTTEDHYFSELELERLCPPGNSEILKSIPKEMACQTGSLDFWYQRCRCHYVKIIACPPCPEDSTIKNSKTYGHGLPHFILGSPQTNSTVVYQIPIGDNSDNNGTTADFATANKFNVYNSAGGIVNLYFYQTGQQQLITPRLENDAPTGSTGRNKSSTTRKPSTKTG